LCHRQLRSTAPALPQRRELELTTRKPQREELTIGIDRHVGDIVHGHHGPDLAPELQIHNHEMPCGVLDDSHAAPRRDPDLALWHCHGLQRAPAGQRHDDDAAPMGVLGNQRERGPLQDHAAARDLPPVRQRHRGSCRKRQPRPRIVSEPTAGDRNRGAHLRRRAREAIHVLEQHHRIACGPQRRRRADRRRI
jgi:hypothetical protein